MHAISFIYFGWRLVAYIVLILSSYQTHPIDPFNRQTYKRCHNRFHCTPNTYNGSPKL